MQGDTEWAWVADVYREVPAVRPGAVTHAMRAAEASVRVRRRVNALLQCAFGAAAVVGFALLGRWVETPTSTTPLAGSGTLPVSVPSAAVSQLRPVLVPAAPSRHPLVGMQATRGATQPVALRAEPQTVPADGPQDTFAASGHTEPIASDRVEIADLTGADLQRLRAGLGDQGLRDLARLVQDAMRNGFPPAPLLDRAMAGVAHGAPSSVILTTVERRALSLRQARNALGTDATDNELTAGADAIEAGVAAPQLVEVQRLFPRGRATAGLLALAGLVTDGVPAPAAATALAQGVGTGASDAMLLALRTGVTADIARGVAPLAALRARVERLGNKTEPEQQSPLLNPTSRLSPTSSSHAP